jgi:flagellar motor protein MotB
VTFNFFPNSSDIWKKAPGDETKLYDPNVERTIADIARLAHKFGASRIHIGGFTDASMKGVADEELVRTLSEQRAIAVRDALVAKHKLDPARLVAQGFGWTRPADPRDPDNHIKNRRVEIRILPAD